VTVLAAEGVEKRFGRQYALRGVDLEVGAGEFLGLFGPNGAGKSTLLRLLAGLARPTDGTVRVEGRELVPDAVAPRRSLGVVTHRTMLYDGLTARENLRLHARLHGVDAVEARVETLLDRVGLARRGSDSPGSFSHGMRKRLSLARALLHDPPVLLLDEPYAGLDQRAAARLDDLLDAEAAVDRTVVLTSHDFEAGLAHADRVVVLVDGRVELDRPAGDREGFEATYRDLVGLPGGRPADAGGVGGP